MPFSPRPALAFPASQTPSGLTPQAEREHRSDYAETQGEAQEVNRRTDGVWIPMPFAPGRYLTNPATVKWVVTKKDVITDRYKISGAEMSWSFSVTGSLTGAANNLRMALPERLVIRQQANTVMWAAAGGAVSLALVQAYPPNKWLDLFLYTLTPWAAGNLQVAGQIVIEVEEA